MTEETTVAKKPRKPRSDSGKPRAARKPKAMTAAVLLAALNTNHDWIASAMADDIVRVSKALTYVSSIIKLAVKAQMEALAKMADDVA